jgi:hypothetical protein
MYGGTMKKNQDSNVFDCPYPQTSPISIEVPAGMHSIVCIEFQGPRIKTAALSRVDNGELIAYLRSCDTNICDSIILRGFYEPVVYTLAFTCVAGVCGGQTDNEPKLLTCINCAGGRDDEYHTFAYTMAYQVPVPEGDQDSNDDIIIITVVCQRTTTVIPSGRIKARHRSHKN